MSAGLAGLDEGEFTEGHELSSNWQVPQAMIGRRLSQAEAKRLLAKFDQRPLTLSPPSDLTVYVRRGRIIRMLPDNFYDFLDGGHGRSHAPFAPSSNCSGRFLRILHHPLSDGLGSGPMARFLELNRSSASSRGQTL
jgi:hypothetical protein